MKGVEELKKSVKKLGEEQLFAVLATVNEEQPYVSLVAFALTADIKNLVFVTPRETRKFRYMEKNSRVSLLIDNSSNQSLDITEALAVTISGKAIEAGGNQREKLLKLFIEKHPDLKDFAESDNSVIVCIDIKRLDIVEKFKNVEVLEF